MRSQVLLLLSYGLLGVVRAEMLEPSPCQSSNSSSSLETLNAVLLRWGNNTDVSYYLQLLPGEHCIRNSSFIRDRANVTIVGNGSVVTCLPGQGLLFYNTTGLRLAGITIDGCGLELDLIRTFVATIKTDLDFFFDLSNVSDQYIAVALGNFEDFEMEDSSIVNTAGLGLLAVNLVGRSTFTNVLFQQNIPNGCFQYHGFNQYDQERVGGGALFKYLDYNDKATGVNSASLSLKNTSFNRNSYCGLAVFYNVNSDFTSGEVNRYLGGGGGLSIELVQLQYNVSVIIENSNFANNTGFYGGGAYIAFFTGVFDSKVVFRGCTFHSNGVDASIAANFSNPVIGSALALYTDLVQPSFQVTNLVRYSPSSLNVVDCSFTNNTAFTGILALFSLYNLIIPESDRSELQFHILRCTFNNNKAVNGPVMFAREYKRYSLQRGVNVVLEDVVMNNNELLLSSGIEFQTTELSGIIHLDQINFTLGGYSLLQHNVGSAIKASSCNVFLQGNVTFHNNSAAYGGAMNLAQSTVVFMMENSNVTFTNNSGAVAGGAIFVNFVTSSTAFVYQDCFLFFGSDLRCGTLDEDCVDITKRGVTVRFDGNSALLGGMIYGSTLQTCNWATEFRKTYFPGLTFTDKRLFEMLFEEKNFTSPLKFSQRPNDFTLVATPILTLSAMTPMKDKAAPSFSLAPGIKEDIELAARDAFGQLIPAVVISRSSTDGFFSIIGSNYTFIESNRTHNSTLLLTTSSSSNPVNETAEVTLFSLGDLAHLSINISIKACPGGFYFNSSYNNCTCLESLNTFSVTCTPEGDVRVPLNTWVGLDEEEAHVVPCSFDFCSRLVKDINTDTQYCNVDYNRSGPGCGVCVANYSIVFGSSRCLRCSNAFLSLFLLFAFLGVVLIAALLFLHINIAGGYLNGVLYFSNIASLYAPLFSVNGTVLFHWLSLKVGIETCFFDGMKPIHIAFLNFFFPLYLYLLVFAIVLLARWSSRFSEWLFRFKSSPTKVFATILVMTYSSLLESCIQALSFTTLQTVTVNGTTGENRWRVDPSQRYFHGLHGLVAMISIVLLLFFLIPAPILWMFPAKIFSIKILRKYKPVYDAVWAPLKPRYLYWVSLRLLYRIPPLLFINFISAPTNLLLLVIFLVVTLFVHGMVQPFKGLPQNTFDGILQLLLLLMVIFSLYFILLQQDSNDREDIVAVNSSVQNIQHMQDTITILLLVLMYATCVIVLIWHLMTVFPHLRKLALVAWSKMTYNKSRGKVSKRHTYSSVTSTGVEQQSVKVETVMQSDSSHATAPDMATFSELREPLLENSTGLANLYTIN